MNDERETPEFEEIRDDRAARIHLWTMRVLHVTLAIGFVLALLGV